MSFGLYVLGFMIMVAGIALGAYYLHVPAHWIGVAVLINIGADLGGMADATQMVTGIPSVVWIPVYAAVIVCLLIWSSYARIARVFKWLTLVLFAYVLAAFLAKPDWNAVLHATFLPHIELSRPYLSVFVAILGTSISPYLFFWQAAQEV